MQKKSNDNPIPQGFENIVLAQMVISTRATIGFLPTHGPGSVTRPTWLSSEAATSIPRRFQVQPRPKGSRKGLTQSSGKVWLITWWTRTTFSEDLPANSLRSQWPCFHRLIVLGYWLLAFLALPFLTGFGPPRLVDQVYAPTQSVSIPELQMIAAARQAPTLTAQTFLLYDIDAQRILFAQNSEMARAPASLTKLMTALLVLEQNDLQGVVTIQQADLVGGTVMGLQVGETIRVEQLLWGLLLPSGNDAAMALARQVSGSADAFVERMNQRAKELGLTATHFVNPHGLDADGHTSSAQDLLVLVQQTLAYPLFRQIVATAKMESAGHALSNTNELLTTYPGVDGIKTGTTDAAGQCLIASLNRDGRRVLAIVMGSSDRYADIRALLHLYEANYRWANGDFNQLGALNRLKDAEGSVWFLQAEGAAPAQLMNRWSSVQLQPLRRLEPPPLDQPWRTGMPAGVVEWRIGNLVVGTQKLVLW